MTPSETYVVLEEYKPAMRRRLDPLYRKYELRYCEDGDWAQFRDFIRAHWSEDHIYLKSPELVKWQQYDTSRRRFNFVFARHLESGEIHSCLGFIPVTQFDPEIPARDIWVGLWNSIPEAAPGLGGELMRFLAKDQRPRSLGALGLSRNTMTSFPRLGITTGTLDHHVLLNPDLVEFRIADKVPAIRRPAGARGGDAELIELNGTEVSAFAMDDFDCSSVYPAKTPAYMYHRYAQHPFYRYHVYGIVRNGRKTGLLATRIVTADGAKAMHIVDFAGHESCWRELGNALLGLVQQAEVEFIDLYSHGIDSASLIACGMTRHQTADPLIVPLYFEPFTRKNKALTFGYAVPEGVNYRVFKGDSDQDRPNRL